MRISRFLLGGACAAMAGSIVLVSEASPAAAHSGTFIGLNFGFAYAPYPYYAPYYYPQPYYYYPPPVVYVPPPVVYAPAPVYTQPAPRVVNPASAPYVARNGQTCREYQTTSVIGGQRRAVYGTACLQPDGAWRIIN